jgi:uncharacterized protein (DUF433 family)
MRLEDYFEFEKFETKHGIAERIRIKGHRISIEHVITYFNQGVPPDYIAREIYPTLTLEEVYATITYYLHNRDEVDAYTERGEKIADAFYQDYLRQEPSEVVKRMRALRDRPEEVERLRRLRSQATQDGKEAV